MPGEALQCCSVVVLPAYMGYVWPFMAHLPYNWELCFPFSASHTHPGCSGQDKVEERHMGLVLVPRLHRVSAHFMVRAVLLLNEDCPLSVCRRPFISLCVAGSPEPAERLGGDIGSRLIFQPAV